MRTPKQAWGEAAPASRRTIKAGLGLLVVGILAFLYLGRFTPLSGGGEAPPGELLIVRASHGSIQSVTAEAELYWATGVPASLQIATTCAGGQEVTVTVIGTLEDDVTRTDACPMTGKLVQDLDVQLAETNAIADLDRGRQIFDLTIDTRSDAKSGAAVQVSAVVSWSAYFEQVFGEGKALQPREARWQGEESVRASAISSNLLIGPVAGRLDELLLLVLGALAGLFLTSLTQQWTDRSATSAASDEPVHNGGPGCGTKDRPVRIAQWKQRRIALREPRRSRRRTARLAGVTRSTRRPAPASNPGSDGQGIYEEGAAVGAGQAAGD
ncbi:hypothetical protein [Intrasporangium sp. YIM S08009]|uniref:hypothetical protein n=1 Tax=Intrasporangium zincisolvens TaxID=3080018 RepID=UPI002B05B53C|nr:hypothetical protein [Intrasporangium sp. YIM S08009]